ncbi:hypothetical protein [Bacillus cereus group sp. BfR-BA-01383]|uniref:hypothetical protein n=1 Tax=Bacillus cereus group sp. BfR-BA-01383 TaxID=2920327 RepID=UPI001F5751CA|nr:hypothetical protein [Bacillus cereus group sp. BfR-BA-01383]
MRVMSEIELEKMIEIEKDKLVVRNDISDTTLKRFLNYYNLFSNNVIDFAEKEGKPTILYSKYYWYTKYKKRYFEVYGYDAGIEQEGVMLLEEIEDDLEDGIDWIIIQDIEERGKYESKSTY